MVKTRPLRISILVSSSRSCWAKSVISINFSEKEKRENLLAHRIPDNKGKLEENKGCVAGWVDMENIYDYLPGIKARAGANGRQRKWPCGLWRSFNASLLKASPPSRTTVFAPFSTSESSFICCVFSSELSFLPSVAQVYMFCGEIAALISVDVELGTTGL